MSISIGPPAAPAPAHQDIVLLNKLELHADQPEPVLEILKKLDGVVGQDCDVQFFGRTKWDWEEMTNERYDGEPSTVRCNFYGVRSSRLRRGGTGLSEELVDEINKRVDQDRMTLLLRLKDTGSPFAGQFNTPEIPFEVTISQTGEPAAHSPVDGLFYVTVNASAENRMRVLWAPDGVPLATQDVQALIFAPQPIGKIVLRF